MNKVLQVALREYIETAKTKAFIIGLFLTPFLVCGIILLMRYTQKEMKKAPEVDRHIAVVDLTGELGLDIERAFSRGSSNHKIVPRIHSRDANIEQLKAQVRKGKLAGCLVVAEDVVEANGKCNYYSKTKNMRDLAVYPVVQNILNNVVVEKRFRINNVSKEYIEELRRRVNVVQEDVTAKGRDRGKSRDMMIARQFAAFFFVYLMFMGIFGTGQQMVTSVIEEKTSRVIEVLLSAVTPFQLMAGKIIGLAAISLTVVLLWGVAAYGAAASQGMGDLVKVHGIVYFLVYFILGFVLISSIFAAAGSACNTAKEAQTLLMPLMMMFMVPLLTWNLITQNPDGTLATVLSFIPPTTPMVMMLRISVMDDLPILQIIASIVLLIVSVPCVMWAAAKVFRTGILMYGKPPSLKELVWWVRYS
ncbi:ABC transporter permease [Candidatus Hydrogenedentota bacterium]